LADKAIEFVTANQDKHQEKVSELTALMKKLDEEITANARPVWRVEE